MAYTFDDPAAHSRRTTQYFEMLGNRANLPRRLDRVHDAADRTVEPQQRQTWTDHGLPVGALSTSPKTSPRPTTWPSEYPDVLKDMQIRFYAEAANTTCCRSTTAGPGGSTRRTGRA